eukprot:CAMPEP_0168333076 /NCGR_PEP_ID=MMETSP0213-20121227/9370_1 /TAXON_ID=151035 /ORGANISM="Euplotes harpa, Strain FSP1.4" /LENGTH=289 /DNA_ID=CAMNT_0008337287 /DNA_START=498 /DNA_END=1368 /DNA_ORIENTATION=-
MSGDDEDMFKVTFVQSMFKSTHGTMLVTSKLETPLNKITILPDVVAVLGASTNTAMTVSMVAMVSTNIIMGQSSELLWGFMNTIQIMYFFPLLQLYFPDNLYTILTYLSSSKLQIEIPQVEAFKTNLKQEYNVSKEQQYEDLGYDSISIFISGEDLFSLIVQSFVICTVVFGLKAILFTLGSNVEVYEKQLQEEYNKERMKIKQLFEDPAKQRKEAEEDEDEKEEKRMTKWFKAKIQNMSSEYKYNFFLRIGIQLYLETCILSLVNIYHPAFKNVFQVLSSLVSLVFLF